MGRRCLVGLDDFVLKIAKSVIQGVKAFKFGVLKQI